MIKMRISDESLWKALADENMLGVFDRQNETEYVVTSDAAGNYLEWIDDAKMLNESALVSLFNSETWLAEKKKHARQEVSRELSEAYELAWKAVPFVLRSVTFQEPHSEDVETMQREFLRANQLLQAAETPDEVDAVLAQIPVPNYRGSVLNQDSTDA